MSDEVRAIYVTGKTLTANVYTPTGADRETGISLTENGSGGLYLGDCATIQNGDLVVILEGGVVRTGYEYTGTGAGQVVTCRGDIGDFKENGVVHFHWSTATAPTTAGTLRVYKDDGTGEVSAPTGITDSRAFDSVTGLHECKIDLNNSTQSFYEKGKNYSVVLVGAVIAAKTVTVVIASFSIENRWANVHFHYGGK
jgi:hypothetical protein